MEYKANAPMNFRRAGNIRELGGYAGAGGRPLNTRRLLRGGDLSRLDQNELEALREYGIRTSIDLRAAEEKYKDDPMSRSDSFFYYSVPIKGSLDHMVPGRIMYDLYIGILEEQKDCFSRTLRLIAREPDGIIFHCTAGKDRTGLTAMLVLSLCGVSEEQIIADYCTSGDNNKDETAEQIAMLEKSGYKGIPHEVFESRPETMAGTIEYLREHYGDTEKYVLSTGLSKEDIGLIRKKMLGD
ncbi:MAG: tyrosine-protein phosphatase [Oscillospiraceae bacterium]|jgi:protein-tyrosine phosphatase